jgi:hypothetical protein
MSWGNHKHDAVKQTPSVETRIDATPSQDPISENKAQESQTHGAGKPMSNVVTPLAPTPTQTTKSSEEKPPEAIWHDAGKLTRSDANRSDTDIRHHI